MSAGLTGTRELLRLDLRRDRVMLAIWVYGLAATVVGTAYSYRSLYDTTAVRLEFSAAVEANASTLAMYGHVYSPGTVGGLVAWRLLGLALSLASVLSILLVVRHTRADEEAGRLELIGAGVVGRHAALAAALLTAVVAQTGIAVLATAGLATLGLPLAGSVAFGCAWMVGTLVFAGVAAVCAQLTESSRSANSIAVAVLGFAYFVRAVGDAGPGWLSWLSPVGWSQQVRPFAGDRWWVLVCSAALLAVAVWVAFALAARRDLGAGLLPARPGPARAGPRLTGPLALSWRLQRLSFASWVVGALVYGAAVGGVADGVGGLVGSSEAARRAIRDLGGQHGLVDAFLALAMGLFGLAAAAYVVQSVVRLRSEETAGRAEPMLAAPVSRVRWVGGHVVVALAGAVAMLLVAGLATGLVHGARSHDLVRQVGRVLEGALVQLPAVLLVGGAVLLLFGLVPRAVEIGGWALLAGCLLLGELGPVLRLPTLVLDVSPFAHVPRLPGGSWHGATLVVLSLLAVCLGAVGFAGAARRDIG